LYRNYPKNEKNEIVNERIKMGQKIHKSLFNNWELLFNEDEIQIHTAISHYNQIATKDLFNKIHKWLLKILKHNELNPWFDHQSLEKFIGQKWFDVCYHLKSERCQTQKIYYSMSLSDLNKVSNVLKMKLKIKNIIEGFKAWKGNELLK
jgi:hypothetical protein